jgi:hypothetical protein
MKVYFATLFAGLICSGATTPHPVEAGQLPEAGQTVQTLNDLMRNDDRRTDRSIHEQITDHIRPDSQFGSNRDQITRYPTAAPTGTKLSLYDSILEDNAAVKMKKSKKTQCVVPLSVDKIDWVGGPNNWHFNDCEHWQRSGHSECPQVGLEPVVKSVVTFQENKPHAKTSKGSKLYLSKSSNLILAKGTNMVLGGCSNDLPPTRPEQWTKVGGCLDLHQPHLPGQQKMCRGSPKECKYVDCSLEEQKKKSPANCGQAYGDEPPICCETTCFYDVRNNRVNVIGKANSTERWHCKRDDHPFEATTFANPNLRSNLDMLPPTRSCTCRCAPAFKCTLEHCSLFDRTHEAYTGGAAHIGRGSSTEQVSCAGHVKKFHHCDSPLR